MSAIDRDIRMAGSVSAALRGRGYAAASESRVLEALEIAMEPRRRQLSDDHHPAFLHPGRSVLIILHDVREVPDGNALALAALHESRDPLLRPSAADVERAAGEDVAGALEALPLPGCENLAEELVLLERGRALAVLAEQLDHLRHLHLRQDLRDWRSVHAEVADVWGPFAQRMEPRLGVRFAHWLRTFRRRLRRDLGPDAAR